MQHYQEKTKARSQRRGGVLLIAALIIVGMWNPVSKGEAARTILQTGAESKTAWEGVYTEAQARAGRVVFEGQLRRLPRRDDHRRRAGGYETQRARLLRELARGHRR